MYSFKNQIRVHYALTDQMNVVYHGRYAEFYEIGRTEALRNLGITYKEIEATGVIMPVVEIHTRFLRPARYDDLLTIVTNLKEIPVHHKIVFNSEIFNETNELLSAGTVTLYFMEATTMKPCKMPEVIKEKLLKFF